jgi:purine-cytosine permease-like protein
MKAIPNSSTSLEKDISFYKLACILISSYALPLPISSFGFLSKNINLSTIFLSTLLGNIILWFIGFAIISTVYEKRENAIENVRGYFGNYGGMAFASVLVLSLIGWYVYVINTFSDDVRPFFSNYISLHHGFELRMGAFLGLLAATLSLGGIRFFKSISVFTFYASILLLTYILTSNFHLLFKGIPTISFSVVLNTIFLEFPGIINFPTIFRHARSKGDAIFALILMSIFITLFEYANIILVYHNQFNISGETLLYVIPICFVFLLGYICNNIFNVYLASACFESFIPRFVGIKGFAIVGLLGTAAYTFIQISAPAEFIISLLNNYIGIVCFSLLVAAITRIIIKHRPREHEKTINFLAWIFGCVVATYLQIHEPDDSIHALFSGMGASGLFFLTVFFIEETAWAIMKLKARRREG